MSNVGASDRQDLEETQVSPGTVTAGAMMRSAREAAGLHVAALAVSMKIPVKKLEALEADRLDLLHDAVFVRALAASVCRALKIDPVPILYKLPLTATPKLNPDERGINAPFHSPNDATAMPLPALLTKPSTLIVAALVLAGTALFFMPGIKDVDVTGEIASQVKEPIDSSMGPIQATQPTVQAAGATPEPIFEANSTVRGPSEASASPAMTGVEAQALKAAVPPSSTVAAGQTETAASRPISPTSIPSSAANRPSSAPVLPSSGTVVFKARGVTWVKVVDAKGIVQLSKTLSEGEVLGASGTAPLSVVIGRVDATDVEVRGQPFNLSTVSRDNVARFEVK